MKWALVTGGAKRLGAALCLTLAEKGYSIAIHYRHSQKEALEIKARCESKGVSADIIQGDFSTSTGAKAFIQHYKEQFSETHLLVNNVGEYLIRSALKTTPEEWESLFQINLHTPHLLCYALSDSLIKQRGQIINIGVSGLPHLTASPYSTAYMLTKEGLRELTRALASELAPKHVRINMVSPGMLDISVNVDEFRNQLPMGRPTTCQEVCRVVSFLIDPASDYITGQNIEVAGGFGW